MLPRPRNLKEGIQPGQKGGSIVAQHGGRLELIEGTWHVKGYPPVLHSRVAAALVRAYLSLRQGTGTKEGWWIVTEPDVILGDNRVIPSLAGWRKERVPEPPSGSRWRMTPDWICEIGSAATLSPSSAAKRDLYRRQRIPFLWEVDVADRCIEIWELGGNPPAHQLTMQVGADEAAVCLAPFQSLQILPASLWT